MKLLPIEAGCRAVVIYCHSRWKGLLGSEIKVIEKYEIGSYGQEWLVTSSIIDGYRTQNGNLIAPEAHLMRIDGNDEQFKQESKKEIIDKLKQSVKENSDVK